MSTTTATATTTTTTPLLNDRTMSDQSLRMYEAASQHTDSYALWTVISEVIRNTLLVLTAILVMILSKRETTTVPLRPWLIVYALQCVVHMFCVCVDFCQRRCRLTSSVFLGIVKSMNTIFSYIWWVIGLYWVLSAREDLLEDAPTLFWLTVIFLTFDVFLSVVGCVIGTGVCCCVIPCIIAVLCTMSNEGRTNGDIIDRPMIKYKYKRLGETAVPSDGIMVECHTNTPNEHALSAENAACTICFSEYENGSELYELPCQHHFHCVCIDKWLQTTPHCPLCKYEIPNTGYQNIDQV